MPRVVAEAAPVATRLVELLAPWDRARLRLTCRALADAVPATSCAPTLAAMVVRDGGRGLLRYGAGDVRPCRGHVLVAMEANAADALRWLVARGPSPLRPEGVWSMAQQSLTWGHDAVWRVLESMVAPERLAERPIMMLSHAIDGGSEALIAERAAAAASRPLATTTDRDAYHYNPDDYDADDYGFSYVMERAAQSGAVGAITPFLRFPTGSYLRRQAALAALAMGRRDLAEPCDWTAISPRRLLECAVLGGELALAEAALRTLPAAPGVMMPLYAAMGRRCWTPAVAEWAYAACGTDLGVHGDSMARHVAASQDSVDALRWLVEHTGYVPTDAALRAACDADALACIEYLLDVGVPPTRDMLVDAMKAGAWRAAGALGARLGPLDVTEFAVLTTHGQKAAWDAVRALRRSALLPPPGPAFLQEFSGPGSVGYSDDIRWVMRVLLAAGYRLDADMRQWLDSVRPHCAGTATRRWRPLARALYHRWHAHCDWLAGGTASGRAS